MDREQVSERLVNVLVSELGLDADKINDGAHFEEDLDVDSLGVVELLMALEDEFDVTAKTNGQGMQTLGDIASYIDQLVAERDAPAARTGS